MNSIGENCNELKKQYDACFNNWFADQFLRGSTNDTACAPLFKVYQQCVKVSVVLASRAERMMQLLRNISTTRPFFLLLLSRWHKKNNRKPWKPSTLNSLRLIRIIWAPNRSLKFRPRKRDLALQLNVADVIAANAAHKPHCYLPNIYINIYIIPTTLCTHGGKRTCILWINNVRACTRALDVHVHWP